MDVIRSTSVRGRSYVSIDFVSGTDVDEKIREVRDKIATVRDELPEDAESPSAQGFRITDRPVLFVFVYGEDNLYRLGKIAEDLRDELETVRGCSSIGIFGSLEREIQVQVDPDGLNAHLISIGEVISALEQQNLDMPNYIK